jgi:hypothetical protein
MAEKQTGYSKDLEAYVQDMLARAKAGAAAAQTAGYPPESAFTQSYYAGIPNLYMYGDPEQLEALQRMQGLYGAYGEAGQYDKTRFDDIGNMYTAAGQYDPAQFDMADYTAQNIQQRMSPYEELVADRQRTRLKKAYDEARGEREAQAVRAGAFGGSGQAIQEELARRNYLEQMADMDAQSLQAAFESGAGLYGKELADRLAAQQAGEASRQFGKQTEFSGLEGLMSARQQEAAQTAAAKEAELAGLAGQSGSASQQAILAEQRKNMQLANLAAKQAAGQQQEERRLAEAQYPLGLAALQGNVLTPLSGGTNQIPQSVQKTSTTQNILGGLSTAAGIVQGLGGVSGIVSGAKAIGGALGLGGGIYRSGGLVPYGYNYRGGGLADFEPQYYDMYER